MTKYYIQRFIEKHEYNKKGKDYVLMFHNVSDNTEEWDDYECSISFDSFKKMIGLLEQDSYQFCTPDSFLKKSSQKSVLLTFDDAYKNVYIKVFPFLREKNIPFIVFQSVSFLDDEKYLSEDMIAEMLKYDKFVLGTHTITHCNLHKSKDYKNEIQEPINIFRKKFGIEPIYFAYPYGAYVTLDLKHIKYAKKIYKAAFSTCRVSWNMLSFKYIIPRININESNYEDFCRAIKE